MPGKTLTPHDQTAKDRKDKLQTLTTDEFIEHASNLANFSKLEILRDQCLSTENMYRSLFARKRESWEIPEIDDPYVFLVDVYKNQSLFRRLPYFSADEDSTPRCFKLSKENLKQEGDLVVMPTQSEFEISWDCFTEGLLRFMDWSNVFCAGGAVSGCLSPLPDDIANLNSQAASRVKRRKYFHDTFLPGSDIDLFLYGLNEEEAEQKLLEIYDAIQAANPYEIRAFRSTHAITLVSQYPFRHVQIILRLYNSPSEILMGFDVDACAVGYNGNKVVVCPRAALAFVTQSNTIDMTRRSPSYEMRLAKYASRGFEVLVPSLDRDRVDPFIYEKRFDQTKGLARLLMMERLRTPLDRLRYRIAGNLKMKFKNGSLDWEVNRAIRRRTGDQFNIDRAEGLDSLIPLVSGPEVSDYSAVFLPWGPNWNVERIEKQVKKKDRIINKVEFFADGRVVKNRRSYKIHLCAVGTMEEVIGDPFPDDPLIPEDVPMEELDSLVRGRVTWLVDNPGRQQIGSFHPITQEDWTEGAFISCVTEEFMVAANTNDADTISLLLDECESKEDAFSLLTSRDFLGRSSLHVATLANSTDVVKILLSHDAVNADFLNLRLSDGRSALHLVAMKGNVEIAKLILDKVKMINKAIEIAAEEEAEIEGEREKTNVDSNTMLDIDGSDWEVKMSPLHYAIILGQVEMVELLLSYGANARKVAVHKDRNESFSVLTLLGLYAAERGERGWHVIKPMAELLIRKGNVSTAQVDTNGATIWHHLACSTNSHKALEILLELDQDRNNGTVRALNVLDSQMRTPLYVATICCNAKAVDMLLKAGAISKFEEQQWDARLQTLSSSGMRNSYRYTSGRGFNQDQEMKRCPIFLAAHNADVQCLEIYLCFDASNLVNSKIRLPSNNRSVDGNIEARVVRPLDILEMNRVEVKSRMERSSRNKHHTQSQLDSIIDSYRELQTHLGAYDKASYESYVLSIVVKRKKDEMKSTELQLNRYNAVSEEEQQEIEEALANIEEACKVIKSYGGYTEPCDKKEQYNANSSHYRHPKQQIDHLTYFYQAYSLELIGRQINFHGMRYNRFLKKALLSQCHQKPAFDLMTAISGQDLGAIQKACQLSKINIVDYVGTTPLFFAVMKTGDIGCVRIIYEVARRQFQAFRDWQESIDDRRKEIEEETEDEQEPQPLKDQLRRLNNLDIASGEVTVKSKPTPDMLRRVLEAAEDSADKQEQESIAFDRTSCSLPPEWLLLYRSTILPDKEKEPKLADFKACLRKNQPYSFSEDWETHPVLLRPIELAVIRGDYKMVEFLIELAVSTGSKNGEMIENTVDEFVESNCNDESDGGTNNESDGEIDDEYNDESFGNQSNGTKLFSRVSLSQLRYALVGDFSRNDTLGGMTLTQIAIAANDVSIFRLIAKFAQFHILPRGAVACWKRELDATDNVKHDKNAREMKDAETQKFLSKPNAWYDVNIPDWIQTSFHTRNEMMCPTCVQFSLSMSSDNVTNALLSGELDTDLLDWIFKAGEKADYFSMKGEIEFGCKDEMHGIIAAAKWLSHQAKKEELSIPMLAFRLIRPQARDSIGRTALFYAPPSLMGDVLNSAVDSSITVMPEKSLLKIRKSILEVETLTGSVTILKAAISSRDVSRVKALIELGCSKTTPSGHMNWGPLHFAIPNKSAPNENEEKARKIIELLFDCASESDLMEFLHSPKAEHTPLMLAANRGVESRTFKLLVNRLAFKKKDFLATRDSELNTVLHLTVRTALSQATEESVQNIVTLLELSNNGYDLGPNQENANGITALEIALNSVLSIWNRGSKRIKNMPRYNAYNKKQTAQSRYEIEREAYKLLNTVANVGRERIAVRFDEVKKSKGRLAGKAKEDTRHQDEPRGLPAVLNICHNRDSFRYQMWQYWSF